MREDWIGSLNTPDTDSPLGNKEDIDRALLEGFLKTATAAAGRL